LLHGRIELDKIVIVVQGLESRMGIIHWLALSTGRSGAQYSLADTTKLVAMEFSISTGWHHKLVVVEFKFSLVGTIDWSLWDLVPIGWHQIWSQWGKTGIHLYIMKNSTNHSFCHNFLRHDILYFTNSF
jgi:hypothetical protein